LPVKSVKPTANTVGTIAPPVNPCSTRNRIIDSMFHANPHSTLESVKRPAESANSQRVESARARNAEKGIITSSAIR
jgi:hypothetical protein